MAGLLDYVNLNDPNTLLGINLLAAAQSGQGFGPGLLGAVQNTQQMARASKRDKREDEEFALQGRYRDAQIQDLQRKSVADARRAAYEAEFYGGAPQQGQLQQMPATGLLADPMSPQAGSAAGGMSQTSPMQSGGRLAQISQQYGVPLEALQTDMLFNGGKKIAELVSKAAEPNWVNVGGNLVNTKAPGFQGGLQDQVSISNDGRATVLRSNNGNPVVGAPAGALDTYAAYQNINNASSAAFTPERVYNPQTQREEIMPRSRVLQGAAQPGMSGPGYAGGSRDGANAESVRMIEREMQNPNLRPGDRDALQREMMRLQQQSGLPQSGNFAAGPSADERAAAEASRTRAVGTASADVVRDTEQRSKIRSATENLSNADRAIELLQLGPTGSAIGSMLDRGAALVGKATPGGNIAAQLDIVSANMVKNVPRFEGPQSNIDVEGYKAAAGRVADRSLPIEQRIAAAQEVKWFENKALAQAGGRPQTGGASGSWDGGTKAEKSPKREFNMLPNASEFAGRRMQAPDGTVYRSKDGRWVKE